MVKRVLTAVFLAPPFLLIIWHGGLYMALLCCAIAALAANEFSDMTIHSKKIHCRRWLTVPWSVAMVLITFKWGFSAVSYGLVVPFLILLVPSLQRGITEGEGDSVAYSLLSVVYCGILVSSILALRQEVPMGQYLVVMLIVMIWMQDTGAYFFGTAFGKHKLSKLSPKKSWEGSAAGLGLSVITGWLIISYTPLTASHDPSIVVGALALVALSGQLGDLFESLLKRDCQIKDSGSIIPGHGGILDRFDSLLTAAPVLYFFCQLLALPKG